MGDSRDPFQRGPRNPFQEKQYSEETAQAIDKEVQDVVGRNYKLASTLLAGNGQFLKVLAKELTERESIDGSELRQRLEKTKAAKLNQPE